MSKFQVMPPLSEEEYLELRTDILARGVLVPVEYDEHGEILDGHHRVQICKELGITEWPRVVRLGLSDKGKLTHARQLNLARRHLDRSQKRDLIAQQLKETPQVSDRRIAEQLGVSHVTVGTVRDELESIGQIDQCPRETSDGRTYPAEREQPASRPVASSLFADEPEEDEAPPERPAAYRYVDPTPAGQKAILDGSKEIRVARGEATRQRNDELRKEALAIPPPAGKYRCIVIDPPWDVQKFERDVRPNQSEALDYPTMSHEQIAAMDLSRNASEDGCHLFCWTTQKHLPPTLEIVNAWGFEYCLVMVWHKPGGPQPWGLPQYNCEFVVYARRGSPQFLDTKQFFACFEAPRREHSRKPDEFYDLIRRVTPEPRIDWFSREKRDGFDQCGVEPGKFAA